MIAAVFLKAATSFGAVIIEQQVRDQDGKPSQVLIYCSENKLRTDYPEGGLTTILDFRNDRILLVDHRSKNYVETGLTQWEKEVSKNLKKENPGLRATERKITVKRTGETATIHGFGAEKVQVLADGQLVEEHWMTKDILFAEVNAIMEKAAFPLSRELGSQLKEGREIHEKLRPYGFSIVVKDYEATYGVKGTEVIEIKRVEKKELKDEVFQPPKGYERITPKPDRK